MTIKWSNSCKKPPQTRHGKTGQKILTRKILDLNLIFLT